MPDNKPTDPREWQQQGPDPEGLGDGQQLFPEGKRYKKYSDYKPIPQDESITLGIRLTRDKKLIAGLCRPTRQARVYVFLFRILPSKEVQQWRCFTRFWNSATNGFRLLTSGQHIELCAIERFPFVQRPYSGCGNEEYWRQDKRRKKEGLFVADFQSMDPDLYSFCLRTAKSLVRDNKRIDMDDLVQEARIRIAQTPNDSAETLKIEARRAMLAFIKSESRRTRNLIFTDFNHSPKDSLED